MNEIITHPHHLLFKHAPYYLGAERIKGNGNICAICREKHDTGFKKKDIILDTFNDRYLLDSNSDWVCERCGTILRNQIYRRCSFFADLQNFKAFSKKDIEPFLFHNFKNIYPPFIFVVTTSYKKHLAIKSKLNLNQKIFIIQFDEKQILFERKRADEIYKQIKILYEFVNKNQIKTGINIRTLWKQRNEIERIRSAEFEIRKYRGESLFDFILYVVNPKKEDNNDPGGKQKTLF